MTNVGEMLMVISAAILVAVLIVGFFAVRSKIQKSMLNKFKDQ